MSCKHENVLPAYTRHPNKWVVIPNLFECQDCQAIIEPSKHRRYKKFKKEVQE